MLTTCPWPPTKYGSILKSGPMGSPTTLADGPPVASNGIPATKYKISTFQGKSYNGIEGKVWLSLTSPMKAVREKLKFALKNKLSLFMYG